METEDSRDKIIMQLELLNKKIAEQNSIKRTFTTGIIYGIGFFIGSAIIATILLGAFGPMVGKIGWIHDNFERGASLK